MPEEDPIAPFVMRPHRLHNFTQLIALLKIKQEKYRDYTYKAVDRSFANVLRENADTFSPDSIIEGYLHEQLIEKFKAYQKSVCGDFDEYLKDKLKEMKKAHDQRIYINRIGNVAELETLLITQPTKFSFRDGLLYDLYLYLNQRRQPLEFLHGSYLNYIKMFMASQGAAGASAAGSALAVGGDGEKGAALMGLVAEFVKLRFNREEMSIEAYEGRYLWAEVFVLYRIGQTELVRHLLNKFEIFFEFIAPKFKSMFLSYCSGRASGFACAVGPNDDKFKRLLYALIDGKAKSDGAVISSAEDYLWLRLVDRDGDRKNIVQDLSKFENPKTLFMACLLAKKYGRGVDILLKSDFSPVAKFFLLRELCLEQALDAAPPAEHGFRSRTGAPSRPMLRNVAYVDESSSTFSLESDSGARVAAHPGRGLTDVNPVFLNFMFGIASRMSRNETKVKFIEMLKSYADYYDIVPFYIIKYDMFDVLAPGPAADAGLEFHLDATMATHVLKKLREMRCNAKLIKLHWLIPADAMVDLLVDVLEDSILTDERTDEQIVEKYLGKDHVGGREKLRSLYNLYKFGVAPSLVNLQKTVIFESNQDLSPYKFVFEKLLPDIVGVIKAERDQAMAKQVFRLCGVLGLSEECCNRTTKELVSLI